MTERSAKKGRPAPRIDLTGAEWKASIATWLAVVYVASWFAIRTGNEADPGPPPPAAPVAEITPAGATPRPPAGATRPAPAKPRAKPRARPRTDVLSGASSRR